MRQKRSSQAIRNPTSCNEPDFFSLLDTQEGDTERSKAHQDIKTPSASTTGHPRYESDKKIDRLFVPLSKEPFDWFRSGQKRWELRRYGRQYTERHVYVGRCVEFRYGYSGTDALWGEICNVILADGIFDFYKKVSFVQVIPVAGSLDDAISITRQILRLHGDVRLIGFEATHMMTAIQLASGFISLVKTGEKTTTVRRGHRPYSLGPAVLLARNQKIAIEILGVRHTVFEELDAEDAVADGYSSVDAFRTGIEVFYPGIRQDEEVTVVKFRLA
jgi:ASC-1-like (ASCH) protein